MDLIICAWAVLHNRAWYRGGSPVVPAPLPGSLTADIELRPEPLPASGDWDAAVLARRRSSGWSPTRT